MPNYSVEVWYRDNDATANMGFKIAGSYSLSTSGTTTTATFTTTMSVRRYDNYGPTWYGKGDNPYGSDYITINGIKKQVHNKNTSGEDGGNGPYEIGNGWVNFPAVTHSFTYTSTSSKTISILAGFCNPPPTSHKISSFLTYMTIPYASTYFHDSHGLTSHSGVNVDSNGNVTLTLPKQSDPTPTYTKSKAPTNIEISPSTVYDGDTVTISCSGSSPGQNLEISGYQFFLKYVNSSSSSTPSTPTGNWDSKLGQAWPEVTKTLESGHEGQYLAVRAQLQVSSSVSSGANVSQYHSDLSRAFYFKINSNRPTTPSRPSVSVNREQITKGQSVTFTIGYNADYLQYQTPDSSSWHTTTSFTVTDEPESSGNYTFRCYNYKNGYYAYSSTVSKYITVNSYPPYAPSEVELTGLQVDGIQGNTNASLIIPNLVTVDLNSGSNNGEYYPTSAYVQLTFSSNYSTILNNRGNSYTVGRVTVSQVSPGYVAIEVPSNFSNTYAGNYIKARAYLTNDYGNSDWTYTSEVYQVPSKPSAPTISSVEAAESGLAPGYFSNSIKITWTNPVIQSGNANITSTQVIYQASSNGSSWGSTILSGINGNNTSGGINTQTVTANFTPGQYYRFGVRVTDTAGRFSDTIATNSQYILYRGYGPELSTEVFSVTGPEEDNMVTVRPYTNTQNLVFSSVRAISDNPITYTIDAYIEQKGLTIPILTNVDPTSTEGDTVFFTVEANNINTLLKNNSLKDNPEDTIWNQNFINVRYRIYARDNSGMTSTINSSQNTQIKFIESPKFVTGEYISLGIEYNAQTTTNKIKMVSTTTSGDFNIANERMFNPGESVFLKFNKATDYNEDIIGYRLFVKRLDTKPAIAFDANYSTGNFEMLKTYSLEELDIDNNEVNMLYPVNSYTMNKFLIFAIAAVDSKGNLSEYKYSETYLIGCRIQNATIDFDAKVDNTDNKLKFTYIISDLGGSRFVNSQIYTYSQYPNFERTISLNGESYNKKARISLEYCLDGNFNNTSSNNYGITSIDYDSNTDFESIGSNNGQPITIATDVLNENFLNKKLYSRLVLIMSTGLGTNELEDFNGLSVNITYSSIYTYYADAPTVSHRANHVGINTNNFSKDEDEIFIVSDFGMRDKIKFIGTNEAGEAMNIVINVKNGTLIGYDTNNNQTILIDLKNRTIDGAIISGGNW